MKYLSLQKLFTRYTTVFTGAVAAFAFYWMNVMDEATKAQIEEALGPYGKIVTPVAAYIVWLGLRAKIQEPKE